MQIKKIKDVEYQQYLDSIEYAGFLQSVEASKKMESNGWKIEYLQFVENNTVVASGMIGMIPLMKVFKYCYVPRGFIMDYHDSVLVERVTTTFKDYLKKEGVIYAELDPAIPLQQRNQDGDVVEDGFNNFDVVDNLKACGCIQLPLKYGYDMTRQCRFVSVLDIKDKTKDEVFNGFISKTRHNIRNALKNSVKIRELSRDELSILKELVDMSGEKQNYETLGLEYYEQEYDYFKENAKVYMSYLDVNEYSLNIQQNIEKEKETITRANETLKENPYSKNSQNRLKIAQKNLESLMVRQEEANELSSKCSGELPLAAAMFLFYKGEVYYLSSGSDERYKRFKGPYALQWFIIQKAVEEGNHSYNFYGISGKFKPGEEGYGVFDFKRGFNAVVEEYIGNFILPCKPFIFKIYNKLKHVC